MGCSKHPNGAGYYLLSQIAYLGILEKTNRTSTHTLNPSFTGDFSIF